MARTAHTAARRYSQSRAALSVAVGLLVIQAGLLAWSAWRHSPTLNEPAHLVAGISNWRFGRFELYRVNPPLVRMLAALPAFAAGVETEWSGFYEGPGARPVANIAERFVELNGSRIFWLITVARWACIPLVLLGGAIAFFWGCELFGPSAGLVAVALWTFSPSVLGHGSLITADVPAAAFGLAAGYFFWRWLRQPCWTTAIVAGVALGIAVLTKFTLLVFYAVWPLLLMLYRPWSRNAWARGHFVGKRNYAGMLAAMMCVSIYVVNVGYGFEGALPRLGDFEFASSLLSGTAKPGNSGNRFSQSWLAGLRLPVPRNYILGIDVQRRDFESYGMPSYLRGQFRDVGWWYYYLYGMAIKVPLGIWALAGLVCVRNLTRLLRKTRAKRSGKTFPTCSGETQAESVVSAEDRTITTRRDDFCVLLPALAIIVLVSSQTGFSEHVRYALPTLPFLFVWISQIGQAPVDPNSAAASSPQLASRFFQRYQIVALALLLTWVIMSSLWVYPHSLSYFNELAGGPKGGPKHLIHSNVDWGQDLLYLKRWLDQHSEASPLYLAYFGRVDPRDAGISYQLPPLIPPGNARAGHTSIPDNLPGGWYAVSVNFVMGYPQQVFDGEGHRRSVYRNALTYWQHFEPVAMAGYSIYIYRVAATPGRTRPDPLKKAKSESRNSDAGASRDTIHYAR